MFQHHLLLIYRNFKRYKSTFLINLVGLSTGLACTLLIYLWVNDELHFDKFHEKDDRLFQAMENWRESTGITTQSGTLHQLAEALQREIPEVEYAATVTPPAFFPKFTLNQNGNKMKAVGRFAGKDYFNMFSFPLTQGNKNQVLEDKNALVLSEKMALKLFNTTKNIIGKAVEWETMGVKQQVTVTGVFKGVPSNSSEEIDFVLAFEAFEKDIMHMHVNWDNPEPFYTYVVLKEDVNLGLVNRKIGSFLKKKSKQAGHRTLFLTSYSDQYLYGKFENGVQVGTRIGYVKLFSLIALFILVIACINFMNLSTAKASRRIKEVGIKKAIGAGRNTLIYQYLGESMLMAFLSLLVALTLVVLLLPQFNQITGKGLSLNLDANLILALLGITFFTGLLAGSYPALYLSGFNPALVLKGKFTNSLAELWTRKGLVVFQFALSVIFIVSVLVVYKQIAYVQHKNLGYDKDQIITFEIEGRVTSNLETFLAEIKKIPGVVNASSKLDNFIGGFGGPRNETTTLDGKEIPVNRVVVNYDFIETLGIPLKAGRTFSREFGTDQGKHVVNQALVDALGIKDPVGKVIKGEGRDLEIIGVVNNFHYKSLHEKIKPFIFALEPESATVILVKIGVGREKETLARLEQFYKDYNPGFPLNYQFLDAAYQAQYVAEQRVAVLSQYFAGLAILISCLGLLGLAAFTAERRRKEIGIRKVLGASEVGIVYLLSGDFTKMVVMAIALALPISWLIIRQWLEHFAYRIDLEGWYFAGAGLITLFIAWLTVSSQAFKAARINPVHCLKDE